jgi:hypothetical protein
MREGVFARAGKELPQPRHRQLAQFEPDAALWYQRARPSTATGPGAKHLGRAAEPRKFARLELLPRAVELAALDAQAQAVAEQGEEACQRTRRAAHQARVAQPRRLACWLAHRPRARAR